MQCSTASSASLTSAPSLVPAQTGEVFQNTVRFPPSVAICLRLSDRRHGVLSRHRIVSVHRERNVIVSSSACKVPFESNWFSRIASWTYRLRILSSDQCEGCLILKRPRTHVRRIKRLFICLLYVYVINLTHSVRHRTGGVCYLTAQSNAKVIKRWC